MRSAANDSVSRIVTNNTITLFYQSAIGVSIISNHNSFRVLSDKIYKGSPYSITALRIPELIPVLGSQPAGDVSHKPGGRLPLLSARPAVLSQPLRGLLPVSLLGKQMHNGCEQFA